MVAPRATVILPTFGGAPFARWALASVQMQTVTDLEICVVCDGSPPAMVDLFHGIAAEDSRIKVFTFPKSPRTGEPHRDGVISETRGEIICYCAHDDLWLPHHVETVAKTLREASFTHTLHQVVQVPNRPMPHEGPIAWVILADLEDPDCQEKMMNGQSFFGLTFAAHTRESYFRLPERWVSTPASHPFTDLYMWRKYLATFGPKCKTTAQYTALNFRKNDRATWPPELREKELRFYLEALRQPAYLEALARLPRVIRA